MNWDTVGAAAGAATGLIGLVFSVFSLRHNKIEAINAILENDRNEAFIKTRRIVHNLPDAYDPAEIKDAYGDQIAFMVTTYDQTGLLLRKRQIPFWLFRDLAMGGTIVKFYEKLRPYIELRRRDDNALYASQFEYLYGRIRRSRR